MDNLAIAHIAAREQTGEGLITGALTKTPEFLASTIIDTGVSLWNSVVDTPSFFLPESLEPDLSNIKLDTYDVLKSVNEDYANFYEENQGLVNTASFIGGVLLPGGAALKGMRYLRSGQFSFMPEALTTTGATKDLTTLRRMVEEAKATTSEFKSLRHNMYVRMAAGEGIEAIATEAAIVGLLSDHPFMEDYMKDPWSNFVIWAGVGGVLGSGIGAIVKNNEIRNTLKEVYTETQNLVTNKEILKRVDIPSLASADLAQRNFYNVNIMKGIAETESYNQLTKEYATRFALKYEADGQELLLNSISDEIKNVEGFTKEQKNEFIKGIQEILKKEGSAGIDKVAFMEIQNVTDIAKKQEFLPTASEQLELLTAERFGNLSRYTANSKELSSYLPAYERLLAKESKETFVGYSPVFKSYVPKSMTWALQTAADLKEGVKTIDVFTNNKDAVDILLRQGKQSNPAYAHKRYIDALKSVQEVKLTRIPEVVIINKDDLPVMNAWLSRASELVTEGKEPVFRIVGESRANFKDLDLSTLGDYLSNRKQEYIAELVKVGASVHEISTRIDIDPRIVESFVFERAPLQAFTNWRKTIDPAAISEYLSPNNRMLKMSVDPRKKFFPQQKIVNGTAVNLDQKVLDQYQKQVIEETVIREGSNMAGTIYRSLEQNRTFWDIVRQRIGEVSQESVGSTFFTSVDQALRKLEDLGTIITQTSKDVFGLSNRVFEQEHTQLSLLVKQINDNELFKQEFADIVNTLSGIPGYTFMDNQGKFWVKEVVINSEGAKVLGKDGALQYNDRMITKANGNQLQARYTIVQEFMTEMQRVGREHLKLNNTIRGIQGANPLNDKGLWIPSFNPVNKYISYVIDPNAQIGLQTRVLVGNSPEQLAGLEVIWKAGEGKSNPHMKLITKSEQSDYNKLQNIVDPIAMDYADIALRHSGASKQAITPDAGELLSTIMQNLHDRYLGGTRKMVSLYLSDIMHQLDFMFTVNQKFTKDQPARGTTKIINYADDSALKVKSILLGESTINQHGTWQVFNNSVKTLMEKALNDTSKIFKRHIEFDNLGAMKKRDFIKLSQDMERAGVTNPFKGYDEYLVGRSRALVKTKELDSLYAQYLKGKAEGKRTSADSLVAATNGIVATIVLRIADLAHPIVNALSLPILTTGNLMSRIPQTFMGIKAGSEVTGGISFATRVMYDGVRARFNPELKFVLDEFRQEGFVAPIVSEATEIMRLLHSGESNAAARINKILDSGIVNTLSTGADFVEKETRALSLMTGYVAAKRAYPGITHEGAKLFAKQFMDRTVGNYHSFQRPVMFQGTFGVAIGLFQTYMLSMAQSMYRNIEYREFKALSATMMTQAGMFGMASLPFYDLTSKFIGEHMSDDHYDLTTGTYRALPNGLAEFILYGLPSNISSLVGNTLGIESLANAKGLSLYTRGDLQPRLPFLTANPAQQLVAVNALMQAYTSVAHIKDKIMAAEGGQQIGQALAEGLSMQSLSRPVARGAELISGYSLSQAGNTIQGPEDIWSFTGITSRLLTSRTTEEQIKRYADHLNSYYGAIDFNNRRRATEAIKQAIRSQNLSDSSLSKIAYEYMRTGTPTGWKSALNEAIVGTDGGIDYRFMKILRPDSPLQKMIADL